MSYEDDMRRAREDLAPVLREARELLSIWQTQFDSGVRPGPDQPNEQRLWDRIESVRRRLA